MAIAADVLTIGQLADATGVASSALRYYEELGLLHPIARESGQRRYDTIAVGIVGVIILLRDLGFTLAEIEQLFAGRGESPTAWRKLATAKLEELDRRIADAQAARVAIEHSLHCPKDDLLECPNFWKVVSDRLAGQPLTEPSP
jgi:MerR family redox-sensitive transcriptional activator SoxR